jgi:enoyl-CoA hydratase
VAQVPPASHSNPRPPEGDWLGTPYLSFERHGPIAVCTIDRPDARNAMTPAMYFGIRYAVGRLNADPDLAGLLITGTGDVFAPGGDMTGGGGADDWITFGAALGMDVTPFDAVRPQPSRLSPRLTGYARGAAFRSPCAATCQW